MPRPAIPARIVLKLNAIVDVAVIEALYRASNAGVDIDLIVRGACSIQPGVPGVSERIRVRSIIGEFLEHSRIWSFDNGGEREYYIGSADLMDRNLDRRVEAVAPGRGPRCPGAAGPIIEVMLADDRRSWQLMPDSTWVRTEVLERPAGHDRHVRGDEGGRPRSTAWPPPPPRRPGSWRRFDGPARVTAPERSPVEVELKYRVLDLAAAERYLVVPTSSARSRRRRRALDADRGPLRRHGVGCAGQGRLCGPPPPVRSRHDRLGEGSRPGRWAGRRGPT